VQVVHDRVAALEERADGVVGEVARFAGALVHLPAIAKHQTTEVIDAVEGRPMLTSGQDFLTEPALALGMFSWLLDRVFPKEPVGSEVKVEVLARRARAVETLAEREEVFPLRVGARRIHGGDGDSRGFAAVGVTNQRDDAVALGDVFLEAFDQRARTLLEVLLHLDLAADSAQVAGQRVATLLELARNRREEDPEPHAVWFLHRNGADLQELEYFVTRRVRKIALTLTRLREGNVDFLATTDPSHSRTEVRRDFEMDHSIRMSQCSLNEKPAPGAWP